MRSKKELYEIILFYYRIEAESIDSHHFTRKFLCNHIFTIFFDKLMTYDEYNFIMDDFNHQRPSSFRHTEFFYEGHSDGNAWWRLTSNTQDEDTHLRITFLEKLVDSCE